MRSLLMGCFLFVFTAVGCNSGGPTLRSQIHDDMESFNAAKSPEYSTPAMRDEQMKAYQEQMQQAQQQQGQPNTSGTGPKKSTSLFGK